MTFPLKPLSLHHLKRGAAPPLLPIAKAIHPAMKHIPPNGVAGPNSFLDGLPSSVKQRPYIDPEKREMPAVKA